MFNSLLFLVVVFGILKVGCIFVNVNLFYMVDEMVCQFQDVEFYVLVIVDMFVDKIFVVIKGYLIFNIIVMGIVDFLLSLLCGIIGLVQKYWDKMVKLVEVLYICFFEVFDIGWMYWDCDYIEVDVYYQDVVFDDIVCL